MPRAIRAGRQAKDALARLKNRFFLPGFLAEMKRLRIGGLSGGNRVRLLTTGDACFDEFVAAINSARRGINLETYIFNSDAVGWMIAELLVKKEIGRAHV